MCPCPGPGRGPWAQTESQGRSARPGAYGEVGVRRGGCGGHASPFGCLDTTPRSQGRKQCCWACSGCYSVSLLCPSPSRPGGRQPSRPERGLLSPQTQVAWLLRGLACRVSDPSDTNPSPLSSAPQPRLLEPKLAVGLGRLPLKLSSAPGAPPPGGLWQATAGCFRAAGLCSHCLSLAAAWQVCVREGMWVE